MGDTEDARELGRKARGVNRSTMAGKLWTGADWVGKYAFKEWWADSDVAAQLQAEMTQYLVDEIGQEATEAVMKELVHLKPGLGQVIAGGRAMWNCDRKMLKVLEWLKNETTAFHLSVFAVNALAEVLPQDFSENEEIKPAN